MLNRSIQPLVDYLVKRGLAKIRDEIIQMLEEVKCMPIPVEGKTNLYFDLGINSLSFISFLLRIEEQYSISFDIAEMEKCLQVDRLITFVESKVKECEERHD